MKKVLSNCPFCCSHYLQIKRQQHCFYVICDNCGSTGPHRQLFEDAIGDWNGLSDSVAVLKNDTQRRMPFSRSNRAG